MGWGPSKPSAPDPAKTAEAQFNYELGATQAGSIVNNPNTFDPYGSTTYNVSGYETVNLPDGKSIQVPRYNQTTALTPAGQNILDQQQNLANKSYGRASGLLGRSSTAGAVPWQKNYSTGQPLRSGFVGDANTINFGPQQRLSGQIDRNYAPNKDFSADRARVEQAVFSRGGNLLDEGRESEIARLAAMGLAPGGEAYGRVADQFERSSNDLAMQAVLAGGQEQSRLLGEDRARSTFNNDAVQSKFAMETALTQMENARRIGDVNLYNKALESFNNTQLATASLNRDKANFRNNLRTAQVGESESIKNAEINRLIGILSGAQVQNPAIPGYFTQGVAAPDYSGLVSNNYNQAVGSYNNFWRGITDVAGAGVEAAGAYYGAT